MALGNRHVTADLFFLFCRQVLVSVQHVEIWSKEQTPFGALLPPYDFSHASRKEGFWDLNLTHQLLLRPHQPRQDFRFPGRLLISWKLLHPAQGATPRAPEMFGIDEQGKAPETATVPMSVTVFLSGVANGHNLRLKGILSRVPKTYMWGLSQWPFSQ